MKLVVLNILNIL